MHNLCIRQLTLANVIEVQWFELTALQLNGFRRLRQLTLANVLEVQWFESTALDCRFVC